MNRHGYAEKVVNQVIFKEILTKQFGIQVFNKGEIWDGGPIDSSEANWSAIYKRIKERFNSKYADKNILTAKINWYWNHNNFPAAARNYLLN